LFIDYFGTKIAIKENGNFFVTMKNTKFAVQAIRHQLKNDIVTNNKLSEKITEECTTPTISRVNSKLFLSIDEKKQVILSDPKFGMFSLFLYHIRRGFKNKQLKKKNAFICSHVCSLVSALPILVFIAQWLVYVTFVIAKTKEYNKTMCPNTASFEKRLLMMGIALIYYTKSFFIWDSIVDRTQSTKMNPSDTVCAILDTFQEFAFNMLIIGTNMIVCYMEDDATNMLLNTLGMEFLMNIDNEFEEIYLNFCSETVEDLYTNVFVSHIQNKILVAANTNKCYKCIRCVIPLKCVNITALLFPFFCVLMIIFAGICK